MLYYGSNELSTLTAGSQPKYKLVQPRIERMENNIAQLETVLQKLVAIVKALLR
jgi:flagellar basal body-associated protein FliL